MENLYVILRLAHIAAGTTALIVAPGAMLAVKGGLWHRRWGKVYFWAMAMVAMSAVVMTSVKPNIFLSMIALFSFYLAFGGYRALYHKRPQDGATTLDWTGLALMAIGSLGLIAWAAVELSRGATMGWVGVTFGLLGTSLAVRDVRDFWTPPEDGRAWLYKHMVGMLSAYIATVSAFSVVNFQFMPPLVRWLWPSVIGSIGIALWVAHYGRGSGKIRGI